MNRLFGFILNFGIAVALACFFLCSPAHSSPTFNPQITTDDFFQLGVEKLLHSNYREAIQNFSKTIEQNNKIGAAYSNRCLAYLQLKEYQNAIADCNEALNFTPKNVEAYLNRGLAHYKQGEYQAAIADNNQVIALNPHDFRAYYNRGMVYTMFENYQQAISDYNKALTETPQISRST